MDIKRTIQQDFRSAGLYLTSDALKTLSAFVASAGGGRDVIDTVIDAVEEHRTEMGSSTISIDLVASILDRLATGGEPISEFEPLQVISAFDCPRYLYDVHRKVFYQSKTEPSIHAGAPDKMQVYIGRMHLLQQRLRRNRLFSAPAFAGMVAGSKGADCELTELKALHSSVGESRFVMGCISQLEDGRYFLEDLSGALPIDISGAATTTGYFTGVLIAVADYVWKPLRWFVQHMSQLPHTYSVKSRYSENVIVVADGRLRGDGVFQVDALGLPPSEQREDSISALQGLNMFGGTQVKGKDLDEVLEMEHQTESRIVFMSDLWLDREETFDRLATMFEGYNALEIVPELFVLMGNFHSKSSSVDTSGGTIPVRCMRDLQEGFASLGQLIAKHPRLQERRWVVVPGPGDPAPGVMLPRPPLPKALTSGLTNTVPHVEFTSNPCRLRWYTQEIVIFRYDLQQRMRRQCLLDPSGGVSDGDMQFEHLASTVVQQSHLCPLPLSQQPVYWQYDHALHLFPLPHLLVLADGGSQSSLDFQGCKCVTPGSLCRDGHFVSYCSDVKEVEMLALPETEDAESM